MSRAPERQPAFPPNPYVIGVPLTGNVGFYGRRDVFQFIDKTLDAGQQRVIVLYGQRRVGKTSILHQTIRQLTGESALLPVYFDLQGKGRQSLSQVLFQLAREIAQAAGLENPPEDAFDEAGNFFTEQVLPRAYAHIGSQCRLLLLFDEFDVLGDEIIASGAAAAPHPFASETLFPYLQNLIMQHDRLAFIFVVGRRIEELPTHFSAIFKQAAYRRIGLMRPEDARELIVEPIHGVIAVKDETIHAILRLTAGHPYFTQLICFETYNYLRSQNQRELSSVDTGLVDQAIETGHGALNWFWEGLPRAERFILSAIAHVTDAQGVASKAAIQQILEKTSHHSNRTGTTRCPGAPRRMGDPESQGGRCVPLHGRTCSPLDAQGTSVRECAP
jgi:AAA ATPase domain